MDPRKIALAAVAGLVAAAGLVAVPHGDAPAPSRPPVASALPPSPFWGDAGRPEIGDVRRRLRACPATDAGIDAACLRGRP